MAKRKPQTSSKNNAPASNQAGDEERALNLVGKAIENQNFASEEEVSAFMAPYADMTIEEVLEALRTGGYITPMDEAHAILLENLEEDNPDLVRKKLQQALQIDPVNVAVLTALALVETSPAKAEKGLRLAITTGEKKWASLPPPEDERWSTMDGTSYLEARSRLGEFLAGQNRLEESLTELRTVMLFVQSDPLDVRYTLMGQLMELRLWDEASKLYQRFEVDDSTDWLYARAMLEFQTQAANASWDTSGHDADWMEEHSTGGLGNIASLFPEQVRAADGLLIKAVADNPWCAVTLITIERPSKHLPTSSADGTVEESQLFCMRQGPGWLINSSAFMWLCVVATPWLMKNGYAKQLS